MYIYPCHKMSGGTSSVQPEPWVDGILPIQSRYKSLSARLVYILKADQSTWRKSTVLVSAIEVFYGKDGQKVRIFTLT